jgi:ribonuclease G
MTDMRSTEGSERHPQRTIGGVRQRKEIIISSNDFESRVAVMEDNHLVEFYSEKPGYQSLVGRIYKGKVETIVGGLEGAFVNIGLRKNAFLPLSEVPWEEFPEIQKPDPGSEAFKKRRRIALRENQEILCQITKEPFGEKGVRVSSYVSLAGRYLVLLPNVNNVGISRRITERKERFRLGEIARNFRKKNLGFIIRTAAERASDEELYKEALELEKTWRQIQETQTRHPAPYLLYEEPDLILKVVRDLFNPEVKNLFVDSHYQYQRLLDFLGKNAPRLRSRLRLYRGETPLFESFKVEDEMKKVLNRKIWLRSGGFITVDETEALVAIDVNTGRFATEDNPERMALLTNLEAAEEAARQIRLRDLSGLVIIDFIDMSRRENISRIVHEFRNHLRSDRAKADFSRISEFGLLEMTRERTRSSLLQSLSEQCPSCQGSGRVLSRSEVAARMARFFSQRSEHYKGKSVQIILAPSVADYLSTDRSELLANLAKRFGLAIKLKVEPGINPSEFKVLERR